jgi:rhodanese-related sulfurtransferase
MEDCKTFRPNVEEAQSFRPNMEEFEISMWPALPVVAKAARLGASEYGECVTEPTHHVIQDIGPDEAVNLIDAGAFLLDVRENEEWLAGHAPQSTHVPMGEIQDRVSELPVDRTVVCVCRVGGRSGAVAKALVAGGYDVRNLDGGMLAWAAAGLPVVTDAGTPGEVV